MKDPTASDHSRLLRHLSTIEPRPEVLQQALERTRDALTDRVIPTTRVPPEACRRSGGRFLHFAAAIAIVLIAAVGGTCLLFFATPGTTSAFAQVQLAIKQVPSVAFSVKVIKVPKGVVSKSGTSIVDLARNCSRFESADGVDIDVFDNKRGAWMHLDSIQKRAVVVQNRAPNRMPSFAAFLEALRDCDPDTVEQAEDGVFDGQTVKRYRVLPEAAISGGVEMLVSVDPKTHLPVRIECTTDKIGGLFQVECRDFSFDQRDPSLFAVVPPQGYSVENYDVPSATAGDNSVKSRKEVMADVADIPTRDLKIDGNDRMRYFLIGPREGVNRPPQGFNLVVVMPGGDGGEGFHPFVRRIYKHAMNNEFLVAQPVAFKWRPSQKIVWPTQGSPVKGQEFSTEDFVEAVVRDVAKRYTLDERHVFTLSWSSSGPAAYAVSLTEETPVTGSYIAMSVFKPEFLPPLKNARGHAYFIDHSKDDRVCPFDDAKAAEEALQESGANVRLNTYAGGHGWRGDSYGRIRDGIGWLEKQAASQ